MEKGRFRIMSRVPQGQGEPPDVIRVKTVTNKVYFCADPDIEWYRDNVPCRRGCPAETRIPEYIDAAARGEYDECYRINREDNILPHILGRVCAHPCENVCRHGFEGMGESVSICWLKRSGADYKKTVLQFKKAEATGKKVAVVGSGPAGLAAAQDLTLWGHSVTMLEGMDKPGGMLRYGIPHFRLPDELIEDEINQVLDIGVELKCGVWVGKDVSIKDLAEKYDAVVMAAGSMVPHSLGIPGEELDRVVPGLKFMSQVNSNELTEVWGHVMVLGGGFTAMDCARSAWRLGADKVTIVYRRSRNELLVDERELKETQIEGIKMMYLLSPVEIKRGNHGAVQEVVMRRNRLGLPDKTGRRSIAPVEGSDASMEVDWLIPAIGQSPDTSPFGEGFDMNLEDYSTGIPGVFAAGDYITGPSDIITAIGHAHRAARSVDRLLTGRERFRLDSRTKVWEQRIPDSYKGWKSIEGNIFDLIPRLEMRALGIEERRDQLREVDTGYLPDDTYWQGERCYLCNHNIQIDQEKCILCYNCVDVCPYDCILMLQEEHVRVKNSSGETVAENKGHTYMIMDEENCVRCGLCIDVCPVPCITMEKKEITREFTG